MDEVKTTNAPVANGRGGVRSGGVQITQKKLSEDGMLGALYAPANSGRRPTVLLLGGSDGRVMHGTAQELARQGYAALALRYFRKGSLPADLIDIPLEYFERAIAWLRSQPVAADGPVTLMGVSKGEELALLLAVTKPEEFDAVVGYCGSSVVWQGVPFNWQGSLRGPRSSWSWNGRQVPFVTYAWAIPSDFVSLRTYRSPFWPFVGAYAQPRYPFAWTPIFERSLLNRPAVAAATIPVEHIQCPIMAVSGTDDQLCPATRFADMLTDRLRSRGYPHHYEHLRYQGAGHLIGLPHSSTGATREGPLELGGTLEANRHMAADSWQRVMDFLGEHTA